MNYLEGETKEIAAFVDELKPDQTFTHLQLIEQLKPRRHVPPLVDLALIFAGIPGLIHAQNVLAALAKCIDAKIWLHAGGGRVSFDSLKNCIWCRLVELNKEEIK